MTNDIIILIPGIGGSRLERDGKPIYDLSFGSLPRLIWNWVGGDLAFQGGSGKPDDGVVATDLFNNQLIPGWFGIDDYDGLAETLSLVVKDPANQFFKFPYDWRASNRWAAEALDAFVRPKLHEWQKGHGGPSAKVWLVCHSMGGLVARYFLEQLGGVDITRRLITISTPHRGAPKALNALVNGMSFGLLNFSTVIRSFASTYELLPQAAVVKVNSGGGEALVRVADFFGMGDLLPLPNGVPPLTVPSGLERLPNIDTARLRDALVFHKAIREPVIRRMNSGVASPYEITCLFNRRQKTPQSATWVNGELQMSDETPLGVPEGEKPLFYQGDGTVPGPSAIPIEWRTAEKALALDEKHVAMPSSHVLTDIVQNLANPLDAHEYMGLPDPNGSLGLTVPPLVMAGDAFEIELDALSTAQVTISATSIQAPGVQALSERVKIGDQEPVRLAFTLSKPGTYQVTARSSDPARPVVSDWVVVAEPA